MEENQEVEVREETTKDILNRYTEVELEIQKAYIEQDAFMKEHKEVFETYEASNDKIAEFRKEQDRIKEELLTKMRETNTFDEENDRFKAKYTAPYTKKNFDTKKFYEDYAEDTAMYKKYVGISNVKESIKISEVKKK